MKKFDLRATKAAIEIPDGRIVLINWSRDDLDANRNVFRLDKNGKMIWQVSSEHDDDVSGPFATIRYENEKLLASRWIGLLYDINLETGFAVVIAETR